MFNAASAQGNNIRNKVLDFFSTLVSILGFFFPAIYVVIIVVVLVIILIVSVISIVNPATFNADLNNSYTASQYGVNASARLMSLDQYDPQNYAHHPELYDAYSASACSTASMTTVLNAYYGKQVYTIGDILQKQIDVGAIDPALGLLTSYGLSKTFASLSPPDFDVEIIEGWDNNRNNVYTLDQIINIANAGSPVIVSFYTGDRRYSPLYNPDMYKIWPNGHILVVAGGDKNNVRLADSSKAETITTELKKVPNSTLKEVSHATFSAWWNGFVAIPKPKHPEKFASINDEFKQKNLAAASMQTSLDNAEYLNLSAEGITPKQLTSWGLPTRLAGEKAPLVKMAYEAARKYNINPVLFVRQIYIESGYNEFVNGPPVSCDGITCQAQGIAQLTPATARFLNVSNPYDAKSALDGAARYMAGFYEKYAKAPGKNTSQYKAIAAYNWGGGYVDYIISVYGSNWEIGLPGEVLANYLNPIRDMRMLTMWENDI